MSIGGRQGLYTDGNLSDQPWNTQRSDQKFTGNPWTQSGNTYGAGSFHTSCIRFFNIVFNTNSNSSIIEVAQTTTGIELQLQ